jgi:hypothetical protein
MRYDFKVLEELLWAGIVAGAVFVLELLAELDPAAVAQDWQTYFVAALAGLARAFAGALLAKIGRAGGGL